MFVPWISAKVRRASLLPICVASCLSAGAPLGAEVRGPDPISRDVAALGSTDAQVRADAQRRLSKLGEPAVPHLRQAAYHRDALVRKTALETLARIRPGSAWNRKVREKLKTAAVDVSARDEPLGRVLLDISRRSGLEIMLSPHLQRAMQEDPMPVSLEVRGCNLEVALAALLDSKKLTYSLVCDGLVVEGGSGLRPELLKTALAEKIPPIELKNATMAQAMEKIKPHVFLGIAMDAEEFAGEIGAKRTISLVTERPLRLETVLSLMLDGHDLGFVFDDRRLLVTSREKAEDRPAAEEYDVAALLAALRDRHGARDPDRELAETIRECVDRMSWKGEGGGTIAIREGRMTVSQRRSACARIREFLNALEACEGVGGGEIGEMLEF